MRWRERGRWSWRLEAKPADVWVGAYVEKREGPMAILYHAWVCVVPMVPLHLVLTRWKGSNDGR